MGALVELHLVVMKEEVERRMEAGEEREEARGVGGARVGGAKMLSAVEMEARRCVAERIEGLMREGRGWWGRMGRFGRGLSVDQDIAILLRGMKDKAMIFARAFARRGIPVHADLSTGYFDAA